MTDDVQQVPRSGLALTLSVSSEQAFVPILELLTARIAEFAGCTAQEARDVGQALGRALDQAWRHFRSAGAPAGIDLAFRSDDRVLQVEVTCPGPLPGGLSLEDVFGGRQAISDLRRLIDRVEFGESGGHPYCRLNCQIHDLR